MLSLGLRPFLCGERLCAGPGMRTGPPSAQAEAPTARDLRRAGPPPGPVPVVTEHVLIVGIACPRLLGQLPHTLLVMFVVPVRPREPHFLFRVLDAEVLMRLGHLLHGPQPAANSMVRGRLWPLRAPMPLICFLRPVLTISNPRKAEPQGSMPPCVEYKPGQLRLGLRLIPPLPPSPSRHPNTPSAWHYRHWNKSASPSVDPSEPLGMRLPLTPSG